MTDKEFVGKIEILQLHRKKLEAVKTIKDRYDIGLKEAKELCDDYWGLTAHSCAMQILTRLKREYLKRKNE